MIARIYDADGNYLKTTDGCAGTVALNVPPGGSFEEVTEYVENVVTAMEVVGGLFDGLW